jgi:hypothetical protein
MSAAAAATAGWAARANAEDPVRLEQRLGHGDLVRSAAPVQPRRRLAPRRPLAGVLEHRVDGRRGALPDVGERAGVGPLVRRRLRGGGGRRQDEDDEGGWGEASEHGTHIGLEPD